MDKRLSFSGFRGIESCELQNLADLNILVGKNGSGKTACLEALLLNQCLAVGRSDAIQFVVRHRVHTANTSPIPWLGVKSLFGTKLDHIEIDVDGEVASLKAGSESNISFNHKQVGASSMGIDVEGGVVTWFDGGVACYIDPDRGHVDRLEYAVSESASRSRPCRA